ncbi:MAG: hypothetical protein HOK67_33015 [Deltaproteobacteria bacterium]|jgi:hypothetical protein|nr:hypothetical protein [Deltaproteobacteria bacterium]
MPRHLAVALLLDYQHGLPPSLESNGLIFIGKQTFDSAVVNMNGPIIPAIGLLFKTTN